MWRSRRRRNTRYATRSSPSHRQLRATPPGERNHAIVKVTKGDAEMEAGDARQQRAGRRPRCRPQTRCYRSGRRHPLQPLSDLGQEHMRVQRTTLGNLRRHTGRTPHRPVVCASPPVPTVSTCLAMSVPGRSLERRYAVATSESVLPSASPLPAPLKLPTAVTQELD